MRKLVFATSAITLTLSACAPEVSQEGSSIAEQSEQEMAMSDIAAKPERSSAPQEPLAKIGIVPVLAPAPVTTPNPMPEPEQSDEPQGRATMPEFTYTHAYKFEAPGDDLGRMQDAHVAACDEMGPQQCRLANFSQNLNGVYGAEASLELYVASDKIRDLTTRMSNLARDFNGERTEANIAGTDTTRQLDQAQLQVQNLLVEKQRLQAIIDDRRSTQAEKRSAAQQLATLAPRLNTDQKQLDWVASQLGFTKMDVSYSSSSLFGPWMPYALIFLLIAAIGGLVYRTQQGKLAEPVPA